MSKKRFLKYIEEMKRALDESVALDLLEQLKLEVQKLPEPSKETKKSGGQSFELPSEVKRLKGEFYALFSDGACRGNPGPGSWGMMAQNSGGQILFEASGVDLSTTNNRMELKGAIESLRALNTYFEENQIDHHLPVFLFSDSRYVLDGLSSWIDGWKQRGWKKADKKTPENLELWMELDELRQLFGDLKQVWVKGHSGHPQNEHCDWLANRALDELGY